MTDKIFYMLVLVDDQDKALDFYTAMLGFEKRADVTYPDGTRFVGVGLPGQEFLIVLWPGSSGQARPAQGRVPAILTIETESCRGTVEALKARGLKFETDVLEFPWGYIAAFDDPAGNRLQFRQGRSDKVRTDT